eukprot:6021732-Pyramimonas_sp.AAC.1
MIDRTALLDRIDCSLPNAILADMTISASTICRLKTDLPSDHVFVASDISTCTPDLSECKNAPPWLAKSP